LSGIQGYLHRFKAVYCASSIASSQALFYA